MNNILEEQQKAELIEIIQEHGLDFLKNYSFEEIRSAMCQELPLLANPRRCYE